MKKTLMIMGLFLLTLTLFSCTTKSIVKQEIIDKRHTEAYSAIETRYEYKYDWFNGEFKYLPITETVFYPEKWEFYVEIYYDDNSTNKKWIEVSNFEYDTHDLGDIYNGKN